jgi:endonuclease/exonuclease/phosphatase (EEP) superfamily protein YafD
MGTRVLAVGAWVVAGALGAIALIQLFGEDGVNEITILAAALTPITYLPAYLVAGYAGLTRRWLLLGLAAGLVVLHLVWVLPVMFAGSHHGPAELRVVESNVYYRNYDATAAGQDIVAQHPDIAVIAEVSPITEPPLSTVLTPSMPYHVDAPSTEPSGVGVWSRYPVTKVADPRAAGLPLVEADVATPSGSLRVYAVHVVAPVDGGRQQWSRQLHEIAGIVNTRPARSVVAGDFNATRWNASFRDLLDTGLTDARVAGNWWEPSWPHASYHLPALLPIDHVLTPDGIDAVSSHTFGLTGSDHRGMAVDLGGGLLTP